MQLPSADDTAADKGTRGTAGEDDLRHVLTVVANELNSVEGRLKDFNTRSIHIIQFSLVLVGVAVFAARDYPEVFAIVPIFWSIWLLYSLTVDRDTVKCIVYAEHLEEQANRTLDLLEISREEALGKRIFGYRLALRGYGSDILSKTGRSRNLIYNASQLFWALIIVSSSVFAIVILQQRGWWYWIPLAVYQTAVWIVAYLTLRTRGRYMAQFRQTLDGITSPDSGACCSEPFE